MFKQGFFSGVDVAPDHYPPSTIDTTADATNTSDDATVATMIQTAFNSPLEARDVADKKVRHRATPTPANLKQVCRHCKKAGQTSIHTGIAEENIFQPSGNALQAPLGEKEVGGEGHCIQNAMTG